MAISTYKTFLMKKTGTGSTATYTKVVDIIDFPDMGGAPETIDVTTLSNKMRTYIEGVQDTGALEFTANYDKTAFQTIKGYTEPGEYAVWFGGTSDGTTLTPTGSEGQFTWTGTVSVYVAGAGVNEGVQMKITCTPSTDIAFSVPQG